MPELKKAPTSPQPRNAVEGFIVSVVAPAVRPWLRETWRGLEHIPADGGAVVAANHLSNSDPFVLGRFFLLGARRMPRFLGKAEVFAVPVLGPLLREAGQIPVHRGTSQAADSFASALEALDAGELVALLPEGTLTRDPNLWPMAGKTGAARLALTSGKPLVPVAMWGPERILPPRRFNTRILLTAMRPAHPVTVVAGPPVDLDDLRGREVTTEVLLEATTRLMAAITETLSQIRGIQPPENLLANPRVVSRSVRVSETRHRRERRTP